MARNNGRSNRSGLKKGPTVPTGELKGWQFEAARIQGRRFYGERKIVTELERSKIRARVEEAEREKKLAARAAISEVGAVAIAQIDPSAEAPPVFESPQAPEPALVA